MTENICCGCSKSKSSRWWIDNPVVRCALVLTMLTLPTCSGNLEEGSHVQNHDEFYWAEVNLTYFNPVTNKQEYETSQGKYGTKSLVETRSGIAVHVRNKENKTHGCDEYDIKLPKEKWIALVERGKCYFTVKIKMATKKYNASAVVIYNNDSDGITIMQHTVEDQVSIFVSQETGRKLARLADQGVRVMMTIIPGKKGTSEFRPNNTISKTSVLFVSISFIVLLIISLAWLVFYYIQRFRFTHAKERLARRLANAAKKAITKIPQKTVKNGDRELDSEFDQCAVCIETYKPHDVIRTLPCKHVFHRSCVDPWLLDHRSCPMCKLDILRAYGMQVFGSQESVHHEAESGGNVAVAVEDQEPSSTTDDQPHGPDTEVKVLLLPHTCLHFHPSASSHGHHHHHHHHHHHDPNTDEDPSTSAGASTSSPDECHSASCPGAVPSRSTDHRLSRSSLCEHETEKQALMSGSGDEDEEEEEDKEARPSQQCKGRRSRSPAAVASGEDSEDDGGALQAAGGGGDAIGLVVRLPSSGSNKKDGLKMPCEDAKGGGDC